jgi:hypothetical protein
MSKNNKGKSPYQIRQEYSAHRLEQLKHPDLIKFHPYWKYVCNGTQLVPCHLQYSGLVLRHDDPWWDSHFPPNDPDCRCRVTSANNDEYTGQMAPID